MSALPTERSGAESVGDSSASRFKSASQSSRRCSTHASAASNVRNARRSGARLRSRSICSRTATRRPVLEVCSRPCDAAADRVGRDREQLGEDLLGRAADPSAVVTEQLELAEQRALVRRVQRQRLAVQRTRGTFARRFDLAFALEVEVRERAEDVRLGAGGGPGATRPAVGLHEGPGGDLEQPHPALAATPVQPEPPIGVVRQLDGRTGAGDPAAGPPGCRPRRGRARRATPRSGRCPGRRARVAPPGAAKPPGHGRGSPGPLRARSSPPARPWAMPPPARVGAHDARSSRPARTPPGRAARGRWRPKSSRLPRPPPALRGPAGPLGSDRDGAAGRPGHAPRRGAPPPRRPGPSPPSLRRAGHGAPPRPPSGGGGPGARGTRDVDRAAACPQGGTREALGPTHASLLIRGGGRRRASGGRIPAPH
jgi:hypothetical protein